jgi:hypothetical protein
VKRALAVALAVVAVTGCSSRRQIDPEVTGSWRIEGTSWYGFCDGPNAFIWIPSRTSTDPDELEAVIYDHYRCTEGISTSERPADEDGIIEDEED